MSDRLVVRGAREHNLRNVSLELPRDQLIVFTGLSGSGKSSLAFDTIYAEGQRRYVESLSSYARQFLGQMDKPDVDFIEGLSPAISIDQKSASRNPRSTVGTITEIYDYLRLLYARVGVPHCPRDGTVVARQTPQQIVDRILELPNGTRFQVLAPVVRGRKGEYESLLDELAGQGYARARIDGEVAELADPPKLARYENHTIEVVVDRLVRRDGIERRLTDSLETALGLAEGVAEVQIMPREGQTAIEAEAVADEILTFSQHLACPVVRAVVRRARAAELLVQLPVRRLPALRRSRDPLRGRRRPGGPRPRCRPSTTAPSSPGPAPAASTSGGCWRRWPPTYEFSTATPWRELKKSDQKVLLHGSGTKQIHVQYRNRYGRTRSYHTTLRGGRSPTCSAGTPRPSRTTSARPSRATCARCPARECGGARLQAREPGGHRRRPQHLRAVRPAPRRGHSTSWRPSTLSERDHLIADRVLKEIHARMRFLLDVGLDYLSLNRSAGTLAGGEAQRIRLASQIGSGLVGVLYVLDEPSDRACTSGTTAS